MQTSKKRSIPERVQKFLNRRQDPDLEQLVLEHTNFARYDINNVSYTSGNQINLLARTIPNMLQDPIIQSCLAVIMETTFQANDKQELVWVKSPYELIKEELDIFHESIGWQDLILLIAYNILLWGNLPLKHIFNEEGVLTHVTPIANFQEVTPIVIGNKTVGYLNKEGNYCYPYEYSYAQLKFYRNLGGISYSTSLRGGSFSQDAYGNDLVNEFTYAPPYLAAASQPWRNIRIIEDALLLNRMDQSNYYRIIAVNVGGQVYSKPSIRLLNFYRNLFKKVRRVSYDSTGMASKGTGQDFEVIIPKTNTQDVEIKDVGGNAEVKDVKDLDMQISKLFSALRVQPTMIGYSNDTPSGLGGGENTETVFDTRFSKVCKTLFYSVSKVLQEIDSVYLQTLGYNVSFKDWSYGTVSTTLLEDKARADNMKVAIDNFKSLAYELNQNQILFNKNYLVESILGPPMSANGMDVKELLRVDTEENDKDEQMVISKYRGTFQEFANKKLIQSLEDMKIFKPTEAKSLITSLANNEKKIEMVKSSSTNINLNAYASSFTPFDENTPIDFEDKVNYVEQTPEELNNLAEVLNSKGSSLSNFASLPISFPVFVPSSIKLTAGDLNNAAVRAISSVILTPEGYVFTNKEDLATFTYLYLTGITSFTVRQAVRTKGVSNEQ